MQGALYGLGHRRRRHSSALHGGQVFGPHGAVAQRFGEQGGRTDGVLHGDVDTHPAHRGHGMCGVADTQQARGVPALGPVEPGVEEFHVIP